MMRERIGVKKEEGEKRDEGKVAIPKGPISGVSVHGARGVPRGSGAKGRGGLVGYGRGFVSLEERVKRAGGGWKLFEKKTGGLGEKRKGEMGAVGHNFSVFKEGKEIRFWVERRAEGRGTCSTVRRVETTGGEAKIKTGKVGEGVQIKIEGGLGDYEGLDQLSRDRIDQGVAEARARADVKVEV